MTLSAEGEDLIASLFPLVEEIQREILPGLDAVEYQKFVELAAKAARVAGPVNED